MRGGVLHRVGSLYVDWKYLTCPDEYLSNNFMFYHQFILVGVQVSLNLEGNIKYICENFLSRINSDMFLNICYPIFFL